MADKDSSVKVEGLYKEKSLLGPGAGYQRDFIFTFIGRRKHQKLASQQVATYSALATK
jgi:hypothetical protein